MHRLIQDTSLLKKAERQSQEIDNMIQTPSVKRDQPILSSLEPPMTVSGLVASVTATVCKNGQMVLVMKVNGRTTELTVKVNLSTLTVMSMMENGLMTKQTASVSTITLTVHSMKDTGVMIFSTEKAKNHGPMAQSTKDNTLEERSME